VSSNLNLMAGPKEIKLDARLSIRQINAVTENIEYDRGRRGATGRSDGGGYSIGVATTPAITRTRTRILLRVPETTAAG
jgi:hypothetical protein